MRDGSGWCVTTPQEEARANQEATCRLRSRHGSTLSHRKMLEQRAMQCARAGKGEDHESTMQD